MAFFSSLFRKPVSTFLPVVPENFEKFQDLDGRVNKLKADLFNKFDTASQKEMKNFTEKFQKLKKEISDLVSGDLGDEGWELISSNNPNEIMDRVLFCLKEIEDKLSTDLFFVDTPIVFEFV